MNKSMKIKDNKNKDKKGKRGGNQALVKSNIHQEKAFFDKLLQTYDDNEKTSLVIIAAKEKIERMFETTRSTDDNVSILENFVLPSEKQIQSMIDYFNDKDTNCKMVMSALIDSSVNKMSPIIKGGSKKKGGAAPEENSLLAIFKGEPNRSPNRNRAANDISRRSIARVRSARSAPSSYDPSIPDDDTGPSISNDDVPLMYGPINSEVKRLMQYIHEKYKTFQIVYNIFIMLSLVTSFITVPFATNYIGVLSMINVDTLFNTASLSPPPLQNQLKITNVTVSGLCDGSNTQLFYNPDKNTVRYSCYAHNDYMRKILHNTLTDPHFLLTNSVIENLNLNITTSEQLRNGVKPAHSLETVINSFGIKKANSTEIKLNMPYEEESYMKKALAWLFNTGVEIKLDDKFFTLLSDVTNKYNENRDKVLETNHIFLSKIKHSLFNYILSGSDNEITENKYRKLILDEFQKLSDMQQKSALLEFNINRILAYVANDDVYKVKPFVLNNFGTKYFDMYQKSSSFLALTDVDKKEFVSTMITAQGAEQRQKTMKDVKDVSKKVLDDMLLQLKFNIAETFDDIRVDEIDDMILVNFGNVIANALANSFTMYSPKLPNVQKQEPTWEDKTWGEKLDATTILGYDNIFKTLQKTFQFFTYRSGENINNVLVRMIERIDGKINNKITALNHRRNTADFTFSTVMSTFQNLNTDESLMTQVQEGAKNTIRQKFDQYANVLHLGLTKQMLTVIQRINKRESLKTDILEETAKIMAMLLPYEYHKFMYMTIPVDTEEMDTTSWMVQQTIEAINQVSPRTPGTKTTASGGTKTTSGAKKTTASGGTKTTSGAKKTTARGGTKTTSGAKKTTSGAKKTTSGAKKTTANGGTKTTGGGTKCTTKKKEMLKEIKNKLNA
jgi:hypothetical protein